jgi:hypothetical protein
MPPGTVAEVIEYYPFGGIRVNQQATSTLGEQRRFTGHEFDAGTGLNYMGMGGMRLSVS